MENRRMVLVAFVGLFLFLLYQAWETDYAKPPQTQAAAGSNTAANAGGHGERCNRCHDVASGVSGPTQQHVQVQTDLMLVDSPWRRRSPPRRAER